MPLVIIITMNFGGSRYYGSTCEQRGTLEMVSVEAVEEQLKKIGFNYHAWGRTEARELPNILLPQEQIYECVNGIYEGGFALLVATNVRVLLIDKKPMNYLTVEDLRFDMISEMDYSHRLIGAQISISTGTKNLRFTSYNQPRLRKLITHVQHCMAEAKQQATDHQEGQRRHLEKINEQLREYLIAQQRHQEELQQQLLKNQSVPSSSLPLQSQQTEGISPLRPKPELADYLYAQGLLAMHASLGSSGEENEKKAGDTTTDATALSLDDRDREKSASSWKDPQGALPVGSDQPDDLYTAGMEEVFGKHSRQLPPPPKKDEGKSAPVSIHHPLEINALRIAYSKLPMALRNRRFGRPSFHAHSQSEGKFTLSQASGAQ